MKRVLRLSMVVLSLAAVVVLLGAAASASRDAVLKQVVIDVKKSAAPFVSSDEVAAIVKDFGYAEGVTSMIEIDPARMESLLEANAFTRNAEVFKQHNGSLNIHIELRNPVLRLVNDYGQSVYLDADGYFIPAVPGRSARVPIANGHIAMDFSQVGGRTLKGISHLISHPDTAKIASLLQVALFCQADEFWRHQATQYYVNAEGEIEMIPRVGDHRIVLGDETQLEEKLHKLRLFMPKPAQKAAGTNSK